MYYVWREALKQKFDCFKNCWLVAITTSYQRESYVSPAPSALYEWYIRDGMHGMAIVDALRTLHVCGRKCTMYYVRYMCADEYALFALDVCGRISVRYTCEDLKYAYVAHQLEMLDKRASLSATYATCVRTKMQNALCTTYATCVRTNMHYLR